jgi:septal ring factor EnvC (AmiA/AmiB activator)
MTGLSDVVGTTEIVGGALVAVALLYQRVRTGTRNAWREEYEAQKARSVRLSEDLETLITEVRSLRNENAELRDEVRELRAENRELREHIDILLGGDS